MSCKLLSAAFLLTSATIGTQAQAVPSFRVTLIPRLPNGQSNSATWINDSGVVTGQSNTIFFTNDNGQVVSTGSSRAYTWTEGASPVDLGTLGTVGQSKSGGNHITNAGGVVGFADNGEGTILTEATLFRPANAGGNLGLGKLNDASISIARSANESGQIVGNAESNNIPTAFIYENGVMRSLINRNRSTATGINESGQISGFYQSDLQFAPNQAFRANANGTFTNLGALGTGTTSFGRGINDAGDVVGESFTTIGNRPLHAFLSRGAGGPMQDLGTLGGTGTSDVSVAFSINNAGQIVGYSLVDTAGSTVGGQHAFLYDNGVMLDLNALTTNLPSGFTLLSAQSINASGQIVGIGDLVGGNGVQAFLLTPVPEPGMLTLFALAPAWLLRRRARI